VIKTLFTLLMLVTLTACATHDSPVNPATDRWGRVRFLLGTWAGEASGDSGKGTVKRTYALAPDGEFIHEQSTSRFEASAPGRKREIRHHVGSITYDKERKTFMLRQAPGNIYALNTDKSMANYLIFDSVPFENRDDNPAARASYEVISPDEFVETLELAEPGKELVERGRIHFKRKK
jgi:ABC-type glycerol-3-phosphate transport system substrate-binding protein